MTVPMPDPHHQNVGAVAARLDALGERVGAQTSHLLGIMKRLDELPDRLDGRYANREVFTEHVKHNEQAHLDMERDHAMLASDVSAFIQATRKEHSDLVGMLEADKRERHARQEELDRERKRIQIAVLTLLVTAILGSLGLLQGLS